MGAASKAKSTVCPPESRTRSAECASAARALGVTSVFGVREMWVRRSGFASLLVSHTHSREYRPLGVHENCGNADSPGVVDGLPSVPELTSVLNHAVRCALLRRLRRLCPLDYRRRHFPMYQFVWPSNDGHYPGVRRPQASSRSGNPSLAKRPRVINHRNGGGGRPQLRGAAVLRKDSRPEC